jgi:hypothetical protein
MSSKISYFEKPDGQIKVYVGGLRRGIICPKKGGYYYRPNGVSPKSKHVGKVFTSIDAVKLSLEN